jgi:hypothetical protein
MGDDGSDNMFRPSYFPGRYRCDRQPLFCGNLLNDKTASIIKKAR